MANPVIRETDFKDLKLVRKGKVRDIYDTGDAFLMVTTDRLSAFDVILTDGIDGKGKVLTQISAFWFKQMEDIVGNHLISVDVNDFPESCRPYADILEGRSMLVKKAEPLPVECIVRGYISGSGWKSYKKEGHVCGISLPVGLKESDKLPEPLYTPSTKADVGDHDINVDFAETVKILGEEKAQKIKELSLAIYNKGAKLALEKGIIIADTKFEFGMFDGEIILIDEVLTPDSSRFWPQESYAPGGGQKSFDKQFVRDWLETLDWDKKAPGPNLPADIIKKTSEKYWEALNLLTGAS
ncbi:Phosphoribosylaminoimidazole-succinocarboxamide synthase [Desulfamplus magnetovallimortis]|uniref:Phosphoribosylaminoimidazole-succinocarboxamide synthase n=1 Tax=Desulfamplus magnetovallimortis TaxID=1246637 RepID=L0R527_9BACT|nr:phosphoribosylaminoimidazolesuccinocarboxamide synthase [Desulfamplus magnetovallimortis]CCO06657.1 Phosphoribosylaminoimidazole-succinocarboxamide synthase [Desulfamplus magnetovallimortis BW-1]SLM32708.1 Phosphoribosylaminoimidazole-succinocarboxamide synthase [Desulfamplus magnetovallimortis]